MGEPGEDCKARVAANLCEGGSRIYGSFHVGAHRVGRVCKDTTGRRVMKYGT